MTTATSVAPVTETVAEIRIVCVSDAETESVIWVIVGGPLFPALRVALQESGFLFSWANLVIASARISYLVAVLDRAIGSKPLDATGLVGNHVDGMAKLGAIGEFLFTLAECYPQSAVVLAVIGPIGCLTGGGAIRH